MKKTTTFALFAISTMSLITSAATLGAVLFGGKKAKEEIDTIREKTNGTIDKLRGALADLDI